MNIRDVITRAFTSFESFLIRGPLRRRGGLRITPMEGSGKFDHKLATQTTNLILRELREPKKPLPRFDPEYANKVAELIIEEPALPPFDTSRADKAAKLIVEDEPPKLVDEDKKND